MRSRSEDIDPQATIDRAFRLNLCGFGRLVTEEGRLARRVARFADVHDDAFVWTRDPDGLYWLGRISGPYFYDNTADAAAVDLVHVRTCDWLPEPVVESETPAAVVATFGRGGRNFQQTHDRTVSNDTQRLWDARSRKRR